MSDTTITPEERARLRSVLSEHGNPQVEDRIILRLLNTIEHAKARAEKAEKELAGADAEIAELRDELEDYRGTEKDAPNILCAVARLVGVYEHSQEIGDDMGEMTLDAVRDMLADKQTAEANVARLTKMVDWLADKLIDCPQVFTNCAVDCAECRKEAARRAVADAESSEKVPCHACKGKGGAEYEPGLLSYVCNVCGGTGQTERRAVAAGEEPCQK